MAMADVLDPKQAQALLTLIHAAHPYPGALPERWTMPNGPTADEAKEVFPKAAIATKGSAGQEEEELPPGYHDHTKAPSEERHRYHLCLSDVESIEYPGTYKFRGNEQYIERVLRVPYLYYKSTGKGNAYLVKDYVYILYAGGAGH
jgi:hypothetical protein